MHDIDRVRLEIPSQGQLFEGAALEAEQFEFEDEGPYSFESGQLFGETGNMELASGMLEVTNEADLEQFVGDLIAKAGGVLGRYVPDREAKALAGILKGAAKQILPAIGGYFGGPIGARFAAQAASDPGRAFGLELEGLSAEDREFEVARRYVDFAGEAVRHLIQTPPGATPATAAAAAAARAAATHAPGLPPAFAQGERPANGGTSGRWVQRGNKITLYGV